MKVTVLNKLDHETLLKATWIKKYLDEVNQGKWKYFFDPELERHGGSIVLTRNSLLRGGLWHRGIATNDFLTKIGARDNYNRNCSFF